MFSIFEKLLGTLNIKVSTKKRFIKAGGNISAGGDIIVGGKSVSSGRENTASIIKTDVFISPLIKRDRIYAELYNNGDDDISNLSVMTSWKQGGSVQERVAYRFFNDNENPILASSHLCSYLRQGEKKIIAGLPLYSDNGVIKLAVSVKGIKSNKTVNKVFSISNNIKLSDR